MKESKSIKVFLLILHNIDMNEIQLVLVLPFIEFMFN